MPELAVIIPFCNEFPLICSTIRALGEELGDRVDFEVIAVDNWCNEIVAQGREPDRGHTLVENLSVGIPWLRVLKYPNKLSQNGSMIPDISPSKRFNVITTDCLPTNSFAVRRQRMMNNQRIRNHKASPPFSIPSNPWHSTTSSAHSSIVRT